MDKLLALLAVTIHHHADLSRGFAVFYFPALPPLSPGSVWFPLAHIPPHRGGTITLAVTL